MRHRRKDIESYVRSQFRDTEIDIDHLELIREEWVGRDLFEVWDCHIREWGRWWVLTPFTNLYKQEGDLKSADFAISFHIGTRERVLWKNDGPAPVREGYEPLDAVFREMDQAADNCGWCPGISRGSM